MYVLSASFIIKNYEIKTDHFYTKGKYLRTRMFFIFLMTFARRLFMHKFESTISQF